ncbi:MAG: hypothetical protein IKO28_00245 [Prevotella sp.]|nr:hypothetical protein [Prevotella sp.]
MELLLYNLTQHIKEQMPSLSMVDEDYGQLEALDNEEVDMYPLTYPAVLIDAPLADWSNLAGKSQKGTATVTVKLIIDCYDDTHNGSGTEDKILGRAEMVKQLHKCLQRYRPIDDGELIRTKSQSYTWKHGIKVYLAEYKVAVTDIIQETMKVDAPRKVAVSVGMLRP